MNGKVLVAGGYGGYTNNLTSAELYDPSIGIWTMTGSMNMARYDHTATLLTNGKVLVTGGFNTSIALNSSELYDPLTGTWSLTNSMSDARYAHTASMLMNGKVLVAGGTGSGTLNTAELYSSS
jgi:N-acetylneuraminic acid mutarotase